ncbi:hypothetical protein A2U01_0085963, partial [Trifolium medium]|nr:hypothetical protein [Trifolium medium]
EPELYSRNTTDSTATKTITFRGSFQPVREDKPDNFENMQSTAVNQGASINNLETQIG